MSSENSVIARKLHDYFEVRNSALDFENETTMKSEPGVLTQILVIGLMSLTCSLTKMTLYLTRLIKRLES